MRPTQAISHRFFGLCVHFFISVCGCMLSLSALAEWAPLAIPSGTTAQHFIQTDTVKQTGPMSIYRQVEALTQDLNGLIEGVISQLTLAEYDCMNTQFRVLSVSRYAKPWAQGDAVFTKVIKPAQREWRSLDAHPYGAEILAMVCPDGTEK